ncbi:MAG: hypothetical protein ACTHNU_11790, partial [Gaiellales bacterium]
MKELEDVRERVGAGRAEEPAVVPARLPGPGISNAALARAILQRQPPGTAPPPVLPGQTLADRAPELIGAEITAVMRGATRGGEWPEFADEMIGAVRNAVGNEATGDQMQEIGRRAHAIADTKHVAAMGVEYSIPAALSMLEQLYHKAAGVDGLTLSFGLEFLTKLLGRDSTTYLSGAFAPNLHTEPPPSAIEDWITIALDAMSDGDTLMKLELEGTVDRLIDLRGQFAAATDTRARQALGSSIGETSRRALLLDRMLQDARKQVGTSNRPLFESVAASLGKITSAAQQASGPETTAMDALGGDLELLGEQRIDLEAVTGQTVGTSIVNPEEAFPKATDAADQQFMSDLQSRVAGESSRVKDLHDKLIPQTYTLPDFVRAYKGWHGFFSQQQEMNDPIVGLAYELTDSVYGKLLGTDTGDTYVSIQQGIGRAIMMPMIVEMVRSGGVTGATSGTDFAKQLSAAGLHRTGGGRATGSASSPSYQYGEMYGRDTGTNEVSSARSLASSRESSTSAAANVVSRVTPDL